MPTREVDIHYEFPKSPSHKDQLVWEHSQAGRQWMSSAVVEGKTRMKFGRFEHYVEPAPSFSRDIKPWWKPIP